MKIFKATLVPLCLLLAACDGGGGDAPQTNTSSWSTPDDPGAQGDATVEGVDSNSNGLRDDVELLILARTDDDNERSSMMVAARDISRALTEYETTLSSDEVDAVMARGISCLASTSLDPVQTVAFLEAAIANTPERETAYREYNRSRGGTIGSMAKYSADECSSFIPEEVE